MLNIDQIHKLNLQLLDYFNNACGDTIHYILGYGSALGAVRHHGFIPWDTDVDVVIPINEYSLMRERLLENLPENMVLHQWDKEKNYHPGFDRLSYRDISHDLVHIDIYPLSGAPNNKIERIKFCEKSYKVYKIIHCKYKNVRYSKKKIYCQFYSLNCC